MLKPQGLTMTGCIEEIDADGNQVSVKLTPIVYSALVAFWNEARSAHTRKIEASAPIQSPLTRYAGLSHEPESPPDSPPPQKLPASQTTAREQLENLFAPALPPLPAVAQAYERMPDNIKQQSSRPLPAARAAAKLKPPKQSARLGGMSADLFDPERFPLLPDHTREVMRTRGVNVFRALRYEAQLEVRDLADLYKCDRSRVGQIEIAHYVTRVVADRMATIFDTPPESVWPLTDDELKAHSGNAKPAPAPEPKIEYAPAATEYPDEVLASVLSGKDILTAWMLHVGIERKALAALYGCSPENIDAMKRSAASHHLSLKTREKLARILSNKKVSCTAVQLLMPIESTYDDMKAPNFEKAATKLRLQRAEDQQRYCTA